jgi:hypothetical protein
MPRRWGDGADLAVSGHLACQDANIAVLERPVRPQRDLDRLLTEFDRTVDVVGGYVDNTEPDLRDGPSELTEGNPGSWVRVTDCGKVVYIKKLEVGMQPSTNFFPSKQL